MKIVCTCSFTQCIARLTFFQDILIEFEDNFTLFSSILIRISKHMIYLE